ncbi:MAG: hypothetical protein ABSF28_01065 [Terracidiphilus sp.]
MKFMHSVRWLLLALLVFAATAQQRASAQAPGTLKTGTFVWDGARWMPVENPAPPPEAAPVADEEVVTDDAPPPLPVYEQPPCPEPNLIWTPGNWHWGLLGYYWVPGAWVPAPYAGALWTPPYWGWAGGRYAFHAGYWGPHVGFYGGVNYGGGFMGIGFSGGTWNGGVFAYNTAVVHVNANVVTNVYVNRTIVEQTTIVNTSHVAFNGGPNGIQHQPTADEQVALHETHTRPTTFQQQHITAAKADTSNLAKNNGGHPTNLASTKPLQAETHPAPAGFKPPPPKPVTELAKAQAPPATVAAVKTASAKTAAVAKAAPAPPAKAVPMPAAKTAPTPAGEPARAAAPLAKEPARPSTPAPATEARPVVTPPAKTPPVTRPETPAPAVKSAPPVATKPVAPAPALKPAPKTVVPPAPKPPAPAPAVKAVPKPAPKPAPKAAPKPEPKEKDKKE